MGVKKGGRWNERKKTMEGKVINERRDEAKEEIKGK